MKLDEMKGMAHCFLLEVFGELGRKKFAFESHWHIDHLCFRTASPDNYFSIKKEFESFSQLLVESEVNGRLISTFKLEHPIIFEDWEIDLIEVPAPKKGKLLANGFEHLEVVCDLTFDEIKTRYKGFQFDESGLAKDFNQELEFPFDGFAVKFHPLSLESVINLEINKSIFSALCSSGVLGHLKSFYPLVAGTFPLNISVPNSDIDILISGSNFELMKMTIHEHFEKFPYFRFSENWIDGEKTLLASFSHQGINFEIFGQQTPSVKQKAYLHFLVEERILKIGRDPLAKRLREARAQGFKTEPAFAKILGLSGDPFEELLMLQRRDNRHLKTVIQSHFMK